MATEQAAAAEEGVVKAYIIGDKPGGGSKSPVPASNAASATGEDLGRAFGNYNAIPPPYPPETCAERFVRSTSLRPNVDSYCTNIEGFGFRLEPTIDLSDEDKRREQLRTALLRDKVFADDDTPVSDTEIDAELLILEARMAHEKVRVEQFFDNCCAETTFTELRSRTRHDLEVTGNAYWEVIRQENGQVCQLVFLPSISVRLLPAEQHAIQVEEIVRTSAISTNKVQRWRKFRRFVQVLDGQFQAYFKELGDTRTMSAKTGKLYDSLADLKRREPKSPAATEVLHFKIHSSVTVYGVPRWVGATLAVLGSRKAEEVNLDYFENKGIPPLALLVSGGKLAAGAADRIADYVETNLKGSQNFHKIMVIEAEPGKSGAMTGGAQGSRVQLEIKPLMSEQLQDALFQQYDANNIEKVGNQFRLPKILRGDMKDFNRATADAAMEYAEQQVFAPERTKFDDVINTKIMPMLGARFWLFTSNSYAENDPPRLNEMIGRDVKEGVLTINEGREIAAQVYGREFKVHEQDWANQPLPIVLEQMKAKSIEADGQNGEVQLASRLVRARDMMLQQEHLKEMQALHFQRLREAGVEEHAVPADVFTTWFEQAPTGTEG